jgi:hypothetical protein
VLSVVAGRWAFTSGIILQNVPRRGCPVLCFGIFLFSFSLESCVLRVVYLCAKTKRRSIWSGSGGKYFFQVRAGIE